MAVDQLETLAEAILQTGRRYGLKFVVTVVIISAGAGLSAGFGLSQFLSSAKDNENSSKVLDQSAKAMELAQKLVQMQGDLNAAHAESERRQTEVESLKASLAQTDKRAADLEGQLNSEREAHGQSRRAYSAVQEELTSARIENEALVARLRVPKPAVDRYRAELDKIGLIPEGEYATLFDGKYILRTDQYAGGSYEACTVTLQKTASGEVNGAQPVRLAAQEMMPGQSLVVTMEGKPVTLAFLGRKFEMGKGTFCEFRLTRR
jgi:outer membrane murein-binding lipoprotein Lpp